MTDFRRWIWDFVFACYADFLGGEKQAKQVNKWNLYSLPTDFKLIAFDEYHPSKSAWRWRISSRFFWNELGP